ncbi:probable alpha-ketoglutarate-dependent hypophosphite dioxygenase [Synchiropus splendidus]|uniref:probable alpha-ketoglutarate-dependent hypophosphite dioxygenase n=1 Tax=Synchiropus splendidus TaxID=270530 RepID=UPI00237EA624|nr:probable alpha-ketoglutarate-dependent hypophosphite dioxygenase [Synchiropus splendidus]
MPSKGEEQMKTCEENIRATYDRQGYLTSLSVLSEAELQEAQEAFRQLEKTHGEAYTQYSLHNIHLQHKWAMDLAKHPKLLRVMMALLGPDVILLDSRFICKYPTVQQEQRRSETHPESGLPYVAWHQDMRYWAVAGGPVISVWLALDDTTKENGALQVIPGSHKSGMFPHHQALRHGNMLTVNQEIPSELLPSQQALLCPLSAGQMSVHDGFLVHASDPNMSQRRRCGFVVRYVSTSAFPIDDPDRPRKFHSTVLISGTDHFNHFSSKRT